MSALVPGPTILVVGEALIDVVSTCAGTTREVGGSPANVALGLARRGHDVMLLTRIGDDPDGEIVRAHLEGSGVVVLQDSVTEQPTSTATAEVGDDGSAEYVFDIGWDVQIGTVSPTSAAVIHTGSIAAFLQPGAEAVLSLLRRAEGAVVTFDPNIRSALLPDHPAAVDAFERFVRLANVVKLSDEDAEWLYPSWSESRVLEHVLNLGTQIAVITSGANGSSLATPSASVHVEAARVDVVDTIGAGDTYMASLIASVAALGHLDPSAAQLRQMGTAATDAAAITVSRRGADLPWTSELGTSAPAAAPRPHEGPDWFDANMDPELRAPLEALRAVFPADYRQWGPEQRRAAATSFLGVGDDTVPGVRWTDHALPGLGDDPELTVRIYTPTASTSDSRPIILHIHGGGMWAGSIGSEHLLAAGVARDVDAVLVSVEYRLAPEHPYPAGIRDCLAALRWVEVSARDLGADPTRIALHGGSAGGGLAIGTALRNRDSDQPVPIVFLVAHYPMLDDRNTSPSSVQVRDIGDAVWNRAANQEGWGWYLGDGAPDHYAAPARARVIDLAGLPPVFLDVGELDLFRDETLALASTLSAAGVPTELHLYPGVFHASETVAPEARVSKTMRDTTLAALRRKLAPRLRERPPLSDN